MEDKTYQRQHDEIQKIKKELHRLRNHIERNDKTHDVIVQQVIAITNFNKAKIGEFNRQSTVFVRWSSIMTAIAILLSLPHEWQVRALTVVSSLMAQVR